MTSYLSASIIHSWNISTAQQSTQGIANMSKDDNLILLEEKIFLSAGAKPKARANYGQLHAIESNSSGVKERQTALSSSPCIREIQDKDARLFQERRNPRRTTKDAPELISVDNLSLVANQQGEKLAYQWKSTPSSEKFSSRASLLSRKLNLPPAKMLSAFRWPPVQEGGNFVNTANTEKLPRPLPSKMNAKNVFQEELWPLPEQQSELDEVPDHRRRKLVNCCPDPLSQRPTSREWPATHEETECVRNSLNTDIYKEPPVYKPFAWEGHEHKHPSQSPLQRYSYYTNNSTRNSPENVDALLMRKLTRCRSVPLPQQPPLRTTAFRAAPSPRTLKSAPVQVMSAFQWPVAQKKSDKRSKHFDSDSVQTITHGMRVKDRSQVDFLQPDTLPLVHCPGELKTLHVTRDERQKDKVTTENVPEGRKGSRLLWRRKKKNVSGNHTQHPLLQDAILAKPRRQARSSDRHKHDNDV